MWRPPENVAFLCQPGRVNYFIYRDPRDMLVSQVFFATDMHEEHGMHAYYKSLPDFGERLKVAITGIDRDGLKMVSVRQRYEGVFQWLEQPGVMCIRFEDLINVEPLMKWRRPATPRGKALNPAAQESCSMKWKEFQTRLQRCGPGWDEENNDW
jgi:hypothetical protein